MDRSNKRGLKRRFIDAYWFIVGLIGLGRPIVDRRAMYGDDPANDPYSIDYDPKGRARGR